MLKRIVIMSVLIFGLVSAIFAEVNPEPKIILKARWGDMDGEFGMSYEAPVFWDLPTNFTVDKEGNIYVADDLHNRIQVFDQNGKFLRTIPPKSIKNYFSYGIGMIVVDHEGSVIVTCGGKKNFRKFTPDGEVLFEKEIPLTVSKFVDSDGNIAMDQGDRTELYSSKDGELIRTEWGYGKATDYESVPLTIKGHKGRTIPIKFRDHRKLAKKRGITIPEEEYGGLIGFDKDNNTYWEYGPTKSGKYMIYIYNERGEKIQELETKPADSFGGKKFEVDYWGNLYQWIRYPKKGMEIWKYERID